MYVYMYKYILYYTYKITYYQHLLLFPSQCSSEQNQVKRETAHKKNNRSVEASKEKQSAPIDHETVFHPSPNTKPRVVYT